MVFLQEKSWKKRVLRNRAQVLTGMIIIFFEKFISFKMLQSLQNLFHPCSILALPPLYIISKSIISIPSTLFRNKIWGFRKCLMKTYFFLFHFVLDLLFSLMDIIDEFFIKHKKISFLKSEFTPTRNRNYLFRWWCKKKAEIFLE